LKQSISVGGLGLFRMMRERLEEAALQDRLDLMELAAEFHHEEVFVWLFRDATHCERELLALFALERKQADTLDVALENGFHPWWSGNREVALKWRASAGLEFAPAPDGFWAEGGWLRATSSWELALPPECSVGQGVWFFPWWVAKGDLTYAALPAGVLTIGGCSFSGRSRLARVTIPEDVLTIGFSAFEGCSDLRQLHIPSSVMIGKAAFCWCKGLMCLEIPSSVTTIGEAAFLGCSGLKRLEIPSSVTTIGAWAFCGCTGLRQLQIPSNLSGLDFRAFYGVTKLEHLTLFGSALSSRVVVVLEYCLASTAKVIGSALVEQRFGRFTIAAA
jgi:hypothetical protein